MPSFGDLFTDLRGEDRTLRVSYHPDRGAVVLSLWSTLCRGSFRMPVDDLGRLLTLLTDMQRVAAPDDSAGGDVTGSGPAATEVGELASAPSVEITGDVSAHRAAVPIQPVPRVA
ncbi:hypothetical protein ONA91_05980 [Micromonospora sp. DR5-3]|uniref:hypothetical protein n=1 Tax=unclassified Micromonospora TaxID=2617518 RepID=UPI0011DAA624|nr:MULTISPECIES: hypothetical protein [unclassified Micromonospora]MCW3814003.1 hypothetical protein [Micromonospora sp. DR5-3]TYC23640.1 hypothetical protein FXF52_14845 [Micromonospora sp. MP36]